MWGGFKYLESYEFFLVRKLCVSRNRLIKAYPDNIKPIPFLAALDHGSPFPPWLAILGSTAYWVIGQFGTKRPRVLSRDTIEREEPVIDTSTVADTLDSDALSRVASIAASAIASKRCRLKSTMR